MSNVVIMVSGSCCMPWLASYEDKLEANIKSMIKSSDVPINYIYIPVTKAMFSGVPKVIYDELMQLYQTKGNLPLPAVIVNQQLIGHTTIDQQKLARAIDNLKGDLK
ncbi:MAG TPA: hypothetical protein DCS67_08940 [Clostridiales bacterium UBA8960]|jgi:hypothetical protein|nr:hypothetical protein [Clostridiales bacterium UBA8960]